MATYLRDHWQARLSFPKAVGVNIALLNSAVAVGLRALISHFDASGAAPHSVLVIVLVLSGVSLLVWQAVGGFRTATVSIRDCGSSAHYYCVLVLMLISSSVILGSLATLSSGFVDYQQQQLDAYSPPAPTFSLTVSDTGLVFVGEIGRGATHALRNMASQVPAGSRLSLSSPGGLIVEARGMANVVGESALATHVDERCFSACTLVFIASEERSLGAQGTLGFHQYDLQSPTPSPWMNPLEEQRKDRAFFQQRRVADWFLDKAYSTPHERLWVPARQELISAGVIRAM